MNRGPAPLDGPVLAVDYGLKRCGFARSDPGRVLATGLPTFSLRSAKDLRRHVRELIEDTPVGGVVLGLPRHLDGRPGDLFEEVQRFGRWIEAELNLPVAYWDERWTSVAAERALLIAPRRVRRDKGAVDRKAAELMLQSFLDGGCPFERLRAPAPTDEGVDSARDGGDT